MTLVWELVNNTNDRQVELASILFKNTILNTTKVIKVSMIPLG
jgi:hypothetical protein